jgi:hypothetical protein
MNSTAHSHTGIPNIGELVANLLLRVFRAGIVAETARFRRFFR